MTYTSFFFFVFLAAVAAAYFLLPLRIRWTALLIASLGFYAAADLRCIPVLLAEALLSFFGARLIRSTPEKSRGKKILLLSLIILIGVLTVFKMARFVKPGISLVMPVGLSYYTFSNISYILDIYWKRYEPETNALKYLLYVSFFPHILQGPIPRYDRLGPQLAEGHCFDYRRVTFGIQLMLYGLFQKLVLADRLGIFVDSVFDGGYENQYGVIILGAVFLYAIQIYMDFAGCVNIAKGTAEIFGVYLEDNFRQPYFATSVEEYWRRWHITLGGFFRDYVGMPVSVSKTVKGWSKNVRKKHGRDAGKNVVTLSALAMVWLCTGLWHGTGLNYLIWALWQGGIIAIGTVFRKQLEGMRTGLKIPDNSRAFHAFRMLRTFILAGIIPRIITRAPSLGAAAVIVRHAFAGTGIYQFHLGKGLEQYGWDRWHFFIALAAILIQLIVSILKERGVHLRERIASWVLPVRWVVYLALLFTVILFGIYGPGYDAKAFVYMDF